MSCEELILRLKTDSFTCTRNLTENCLKEETTGGHEKYENRPIKYYRHPREQIMVGSIGKIIAFKICAYGQSIGRPSQHGLKRTDSGRSAREKDQIQIHCSISQTAQFTAIRIISWRFG